MLWALAQPVSFLGLLAAFCAALLLRRGVHYLCCAATAPGKFGGTQRTTAFDVRRDVDPYGVVAALIGGTGWGSAAQAYVRGRILALLAAPLVVIAASQLVFALYTLRGFNSVSLWLLYPSDVLRGMAGEPAQQFVLSLAVGLLAFGVVALLPLPPLDGWTLLTRVAATGSRGWQQTRYWLEDRNIGALILLVSVLFPLFSGRPLLLYLLDVLLTPVLHAWG